MLDFFVMCVLMCDNRNWGFCELCGIGIAYPLVVGVVLYFFYVDEFVGLCEY